MNPPSRYGSATTPCAAINQPRDPEAQEAKYISLPTRQVKLYPNLPGYWRKKPAVRLGPKYPPQQLDTPTPGQLANPQRGRSPPPSAQRDPPLERGRSKVYGEDRRPGPVASKASLLKSSGRNA